MTFLTSYLSSAVTLAPADVAGAVPLTNWNNYVANTTWPATQGTTNLKDSTGATTGAGLSMSGVKNGWRNNASSVTSASTPNARLLHDVFILKSGDTDTYTFTSLPAVGNYDVYVYLSGQDNNNTVVVRCTNNGVVYYQTTPPGTAVTNNQVLVPGNNTIAGTYPNCNYVVFSGVNPAANAITLVIQQGGTSVNGGVAGVQLIPSSPTFLAIAPQPKTLSIAVGQNATFTSGAVGNPVATTYQWYQISNGVTNLIVGANSSSYTAAAVTASAGYFVVVGNGLTNVTSSVAGLNTYTSGIWNTSSGSWNTPGSWVGGVTANGINATAWFTNALGGTVTLDNAVGFTVGTNIFGVSGAMASQSPWVINSGSPAGVLTMADDPTVPATVVSGGVSNTVTGVPVFTVYSNNAVTINAPLAGNQGLYVNGGGSLILAGGNTNNTCSGPTVIGVGNSDVTELQIGNGGTSGAIDFSNNIYMAGFSHLIFNRSDTVNVSSIFINQSAKGANVIVNSGTVIMSPSANVQPWLGAIVNSGGTLVLNCATNASVINNRTGSVNITNGTPNTVAMGNSGYTGLAINSGGTVLLSGPGGNGANISTEDGVLDNGVFDLGGDAVQLRFITGAGFVRNSGTNLATLTLGGLSPATFNWDGTIANGGTSQTAVTLAGGTTTFTGPNTYTGNTILAGGALVLTNSASLASANIIISGANLILANTPTITNPHATISVGANRTLDLSGLADSFTLNVGQTLVVTNTGKVSTGGRPFVAATGSTLVAGGNGTVGSMTINGDLTLNGNTNMFDLATASTEDSGVNDEIVGVTNLNLSGNITIKINPSFNNIFTPSTTYKLIKYAGSLANTATFTVIPATLGGNTTTIDTTSQPGYVLLTTGGSSPPLITPAALTIDACTGYPITLSPAVSGSIPMTFQWFNGTTPISGATSANYAFTPAIPGVYTYTLWTTNAFGTDHKTITVNVGSPTISVQCALNTGYYANSLYLAPTDTAGVFGVSNWNVISVTPTQGASGTAAGITGTGLMDANGFATPVVFTAVNVQDGWHQDDPITPADTANARFMNTFWKVNPSHTPAATNMVFTFTNLPNDTYDAYLYLMQVHVANGQFANGAVFAGDGNTNYIQEFIHFNSSSNFVTAFNITGTGTIPGVNYLKLRVSTGGTNAIAITTVWTGGADGIGVSGIQLVPVVPTPAVLVKQPSSQRVLTNMTGSFAVQADGFPLAYQWYRINAGVTNLIGSATNASYTTDQVQDRDTGTGFFVVISNSLNTVASSTAILTVGHMLMTAGWLTEEQFFGQGTDPNVVLTQMFPNSAWLAANPPAKTEYLNAFDSNRDLPDSSAERIYGLFTPSISGEYVFFMATDDAGALWLSTDSDAANSYLIAQNNYWMTWRDWTCSDTNCAEYTKGYYPYGEFRSDMFETYQGGGANADNEYTTGWFPWPSLDYNNGGIPLVAGNKYYIEMDHFQINGGQNAALTYKLIGNPDPSSNSVSLFAGNNISTSVPDSLLPVPTPVVSMVVSGSKVVINGSNGMVNALCNLLTSTNLTQWTLSASRCFDANGNYSNTNAMSSLTPQTFYRLQMLP